MQDVVTKKETKMNPLQAALQIVLSNTMVMYFKAHASHWNVEGMFFPQFHEFFGDLYEELHGAVDPIAEQMRAINAYGPVSLAEVLRNTTCTEDETRRVSVRDMIASLQRANGSVIESLNAAFNLAEQANNQGLMDFLAGRLDTHAKHGWMLTATSKSFGE
jgi:starvation-inducible DNA-binding protein